MLQTIHSVDVIQQCSTRDYDARRQRIVQLNKARMMYAVDLITTLQLNSL